MKKSGYFWVGYSDLMTSLFFIMLVLYVVSFLLYKKQLTQLEYTNTELDKVKNRLIIEAEKAKILDEVEQNLKPLRNNKALFRYEEEYKRFTLAFDVRFNIRRTEINKKGLVNYSNTIGKINSAGDELQKVINTLLRNRKTNEKMKNVSYLVIIAGYASQLKNEDQYTEYERSYKRAYHLWEHWRNRGIDFEAEKYKGLIDLQIAGNGWGGVGRFRRDPENNFRNETGNQRFIIQIVPKIGEEL